MACSIEIELGQEEGEEELNIWSMDEATSATARDISDYIIDRINDYDDKRLKGIELFEYWRVDFENFTSTVYKKTTTKTKLLRDYLLDNGVWIPKNRRPIADNLVATSMKEWEAWPNGVPKTQYLNKARAAYRARFTKEIDRRFDQVLADDKEEKEEDTHKEDTHDKSTEPIEDLEVLVVKVKAEAKGTNTTEESHVFLTEAGHQIEQAQATDIVQILSDKATTHAPLKSNPIDDDNEYFATDRYRPDEFHGIKIDTGAAGKSTAGFNQYAAYERLFGRTLIKTAQEGTVKAKFDINLTTFIDSITISTNCYLTEAKLHRRFDHLPATQHLRISLRRMRSIYRQQRGWHKWEERTRRARKKRRQIDKKRLPVSVQQGSARSHDLQGMIKVTRR
jgi:hypothetical protein